MGWFLGSGYAVIQQDDSATYPALKHHVPLGDEDYCYATYPAMPTWCRYCHEEGHTKFGCKKALSNILCYNCDTYGHKRENCPRPSTKKAGNPPNKKARKTPLNNTQHNGSSSHTHNTRHNTTIINNQDDTADLSSHKVASQLSNDLPTSPKPNTITPSLALRNSKHAPQSDHQPTIGTNITINTLMDDTEDELDSDYTPTSDDESMEGNAITMDEMDSLINDAPPTTPNPSTTQTPLTPETQLHNHEAILPTDTNQYQ
jgi:hypothetical protein